MRLGFSFGSLVFGCLILLLGVSLLFEAIFCVSVPLPVFIGIILILAGVRIILRRKQCK